MRIILLVTCLLFISCKKEAKSTEQTSNPKFQAELLFEHDGVKVYRFYDGRSIYYTDCRGKTSYTQEYDVESVK